MVSGGVLAKFKAPIPYVMPRVETYTTKCMFRVLGNGIYAGNKK